MSVNHRYPDEVGQIVVLLSSDESFDHLSPTESSGTWVVEEISKNRFPRPNYVEETRMSVRQLRNVTTGKVRRVSLYRGRFRVI
jgi:hypothetical protein